MSQLPDLESLRPLVLVGDLGSLSSAAAKLGIAQLSASKRPSTPERRIGLALVERTRRGSQLTERFRRCRSRVRTASVMTLMRWGPVRDLRKICQDFRCAMPRSTGALAAAGARLTVHWVRASSPPGGRSGPVVPQGPAPM